MLGGITEVEVDPETTKVIVEAGIIEVKELINVVGAVIISVVGLVVISVVGLVVISVVGLIVLSVVELITTEVVFMKIG